MLYRTLGRTGEKVSNLGFGCMRLPTLGGVEAQIDEKAATRLLHHAIDHGVNCVDTAYSYHHGKSEPWLGRALQGGFREKVLLSTKLPSWNINTFKNCDRYLQEQLLHLRTDRIDLYLLHSLVRKWWDNLKNANIFEFLDKAIESGRIRYAGFSFHDDYELFKEIVDSYEWSFCLIQYNYMDEHSQAGRRGLEYAASRGLGVMVMEPLHGGVLANHLPADAIEIISKADIKRKPAELALRWVWNHPQVSTVLSGMNAISQLEENLTVASGAKPNSLNREELTLIENIRGRLRERMRIPCTECNYCLPCPEAINIPKIFSLYNELFMFEDRNGPAWIYNNVLTSGEKPTRCVECGECEASCPQQILIIEALRNCHQALT